MKKRVDKEKNINNHNNWEVIPLIFNINTIFTVVMLVVALIEIDDNDL